MSTTTIRLSDELKARVAAAAEQAGMTAHGFIVEAVAEKAAQVEARSAFHAEATQRLAEIARSGKTVPWDVMRQYLLDKVAGRKPKPPRPRKLVL